MQNVECEIFIRKVDLLQFRASIEKKMLPLLQSNVKNKLTFYEKNFISIACGGYVRYSL